MANNLSASYQPAWLTYQINGRDNNFTSIQDIQANKIMAAFPSTCTLNTGVQVDTFEVWVKSNNQVAEFDVYQFIPQDTFAAFFTALNALVPADMFEFYDEWVGYRLRDVIPVKNLILGAAHVQNKVFNPQTTTTNIYVDLGNSLGKQIFTVTGVASVSQSEYEAIYA